MQKKISVWAAALFVIIGAVVAAMASVLAIGGTYRAKIAEYDSLYSEKAAELERQIEVNKSSIEGYGELAGELYSIDQAYRQMYPGELDDDAIKTAVLNGYIAGVGDKYGYYFPKDQADAYKESAAGETEGIGISVVQNQTYGCFEVISVYKDSPAERAGIHVGDLITDVILDDGSRESVTSLGYDVALTKLRGESGTTAHFVVARDEDGDGVYDELEFTVERKKIDAESVMARLYEPDPTIAVIRITGFEKNTPDQFYAAMDEMKAAGAEKFVFDLRSNPGGDKDSVSSILDYLLPEGPILRTVDSDGNYKVLTTSDAKYLDMPMAVLVNGSTASAAELFAASVKDYGVGKVVGDVTYGKGSMQTIFDIFSDGSLLKLTVAYYCPPYSENYDGVGVKPDVEVALDESLAGVSIYKLSDTEDNQLTEAVKTFG